MMTRNPLFRDPVFRSLASFASDLDRACTAPARSVTRAAAPAMNIFATEERLTIEADVPGLALEDIEIVLNGDELTIRASRAASQPEGATTLRRERPVGSFERTFNLPSEIDTENASASLDRGVLTIALPKSQAARPRRLAITPGATSLGTGESQQASTPADPSEN